METQNELFNTEIGNDADILLAEMSTVDPGPDDEDNDDDDDDAGLNHDEDDDLSLNIDDDDVEE